MGEHSWLWNLSLPNPLTSLIGSLDAKIQYLRPFAERFQSLWTNPSYVLMVLVSDLNAQPTITPFVNGIGNCNHFAHCHHLSISIPFETAIFNTFLVKFETNFDSDSDDLNCIVLTNNVLRFQLRTKQVPKIQSIEKIRFIHMVNVKARWNSVEETLMFKSNLNLNLNGFTWRILNATINYCRFCSSCDIVLFFNLCFKLVHFSFGKIAFCCLELNFIELLEVDYMEYKRIWYDFVGFQIV